jgi:exonuclease III
VWKSKEAAVAFVVDASVRDNILKFTPIYGRLCSLCVKTKFYNLSIINAYAPTEDKDELIKDQFYYKLEQACETMPSSDVQIIVGDLNAQVGKEETFQGTIGLHSLHNTSNDNGP